MEEKEGNITGRSMCRRQVKQPVAELSSQQAARDSDRQHANCRKGLQRWNLGSGSDRGLYRSHTLVLTTRTVPMGLMTLELHGPAARGRLRLGDWTCPAQKEGYKDRESIRQSH